MKRYYSNSYCIVFSLILLFNSSAFGADSLSETESWWLIKPMRMIQTNLREIDAITLDVDTFTQHILDINADVVMVNVGGIVANYSTDLEYHYRNPNLKSDLIGDIVKRMHEENIRVIGRFDFSKINETLAVKRPEWLYKSVKGETVSYNGQVHTCINGGYQQEYLFEILNEAIDRHQLDGIFFNMIGYVTSDYSGNYHGICQCDACRRRFSNWSGGLDLPVEQNGNDPVFRKYQEFKVETSDELFRRVNSFIKSKNDNIAICTYTDAGVDIIRSESNSALNRPLPEWNYASSDNVKTALGSWLDKAIANIAINFVDFPYRHAAVASSLTGQRLAQDMIHGGWLDFCVIGRLENQDDRTGLGIVKDIYDFHALNDQWLTDTIPVADVCLIKPSGSGRREYLGMFRILSENQVLFDVIDDKALKSDETPRKLDDYPVIILPDMRNMSEQTCKRLDTYVSKGGKILATGMTSTRDDQGNPLDSIRLKSAGVKSITKIHPQTRGAYFRIRESDKQKLNDPRLDNLDIAYLDSDFIECELNESADGLLGFIPVGMFGPPEKAYYSEVTDIPGLLFSKFGGGEFAFFPWLIGSQYQSRSNFAHAVLVMGALDGLLGLDRSLITPKETSPTVEISYRKSADGDFSWIGLVNLSGQLGTAFHEPLPITSIQFEFQADKDIRRVRLLKSGTEIDFTTSSDGITTCVVPILNRYEIAVCEYE